MRNQEINFDRIASAIEFLSENFRDQPSLDEVAEKVHLSPHHFQRIFKEWAGVSPKKFLQYVSVQYAKSMLKEQQPSLFEVAHETGLSGTGRLHDLFINLEGMTPGEYKQGGEGLTINYSFAESPFGDILIGSTTKGICHISFIENQSEKLLALKAQFPRAELNQMTDLNQQSALQVFRNDWSNPVMVKLHLKGSDFQLKVWEALLKIPMGKLSTYGNIAKEINRPSASRAVGTAIGSNPVAFLIPCHRVIQSTGNFGGYLWGPTRKTAMIGWEAVRSSMS